MVFFLSLVFQQGSVDKEIITRKKKELYAQCKNRGEKSGKMEKTKWIYSWFMERGCKEGFWENLKKNHPLTYEITQWVILGISILAIIINIANGR